MASAIEKAFRSCVLKPQPRRNKRASIADKTASSASICSQWTKESWRCSKLIKRPCVLGRRPP